MKKVLVTICGRAGSKGLASKNLREFCGRPMVYYSLAGALLLRDTRPDLAVDLCLNTDSEELRQLVAAKYPEAVYLERGESLAGDAVPKEDVYRDCLTRMEALRGCRYDMLMDLDITSPLRRTRDILGIVELYESDAATDVVLSAAPSRRNPFYNMGRLDGEGWASRVIENRNTARQQAPVCCDFNASLYVFNRDFLVDRMTFDLWQGHCRAYMMCDTGILDIDSEQDFELMQVIGGYLFENDPEFRAVRDSVRR